jgi:predicted Zn-dependent protease
MLIPVPAREAAAPLLEPAAPLSGTIRPAVVDETLRVVVLADFLEAGDLNELRSLLRREFHTLRQKDKLFVIIVRAAETLFVPPVRSWPALEKHLGEVLREGAEPASARLPPAALYELVASLIPQPAEAWSRILLAGRLPPPPHGLLEDYIHARMVTLLGKARAVLRVWPPQAASWLPLTENVAGAKWFEVEWEPESVEEGFEIRSVRPGGVERRYLAVSPGFVPPRFDELAGLIAAVEAAGQAGAGAGELEALRRRIGLHPGWIRALEAGAALAERLGDHREAASFLAALARRLPQDHNVLRRYALAMAHSAPPAQAEPVLRRAVLAFPDDALLLELLARARIAQQDLAEAHALARRSLALAPDNVTLWWIAADLARDLGNAQAEREALRAALDREPDRADRRARLIVLALEAGDGGQARRALEEAEGRTPNDTAILASYAAAWERLSEPARALQLWLRAVDVDSRFENGYVAAARLLGAAGDWTRSLATALRGLEQLPDSAPLHLARVQALVQLGRLQEARKVIHAASARVTDRALAKLRAEMEELFGGPAAVEAWRRYLDLLEADHADQGGLEQARKRAVFAALRAGDPEAAARWMGMPEGDGAAQEAPRDDAVVIPGGVKLLQFLSAIGGPQDPGEYLVAFSRAIAQRSEAVSEEQWKRQLEPLFEDYTRLGELRALFAGRSGGLLVSLDLSTKSAAQRTRKALDLLGYRLRSSRGRVLLEPRLDQKRAKRQNLAAALEFDERAAGTALQSGQAYHLRIPDEEAPIVLGAKAWSELRKRYPNPIGFAGMLMSDPRLARLFAGLSAAGSAAAAALVEQIGMQKLVSDYAGLLYLYGPALALDRNGKCRVPGGENAESVWQDLVGVHPRDGPAFLKALLAKDDGMMVAFFAALHGVTRERQRWFLSSARRARLFYELMRDAPEWKAGVGRGVRKSPIVELFRRLPLAGDGSVHFPGGAQVWQVARGSSELDRIEGLARRAQRAQPAEEDAILSRMARRRYEANQERFSPLENFLAVSEVEQALGRELAPREALILSEHFARYEWAFPFLTALPGLGEREFQAFFLWARSLENTDTVKANLTLGLMGNVALLAGLLVRSGRLDPQVAARAFYELCEGLRRGSEMESHGSAAARALRTLAVALKAPPAGLQVAVEDALFGPADTLLGERRRREYRKVLELQKVPGVDLILDAFEAAESAARGPSEAREAAATIEKCLPSLVVIPLARTSRPRPELKQQLELWQTRDVVEAVRSLRERAARRRPSARDLERSSAEARRALTPWLELALRGLVMSFYLRPEDLPVSEDPLLLRKYQYYPGKDVANSFFPAPNFKLDSATVGAIPSGSLAGILQVAGRIAMAGQAGAGGFAEAVEAQQLGAIRNALFWRLRNEDLRALHLAVLAGREWVVEAAFDEGEARLLEEAAAGLVSAERLARLDRLLVRLQRAQQAGLVASWSTRDYVETWRSVWETLSLSDLYWLGRRRSRGTERSLAWAALKRMPALVHEGAVHELGVVPLEHARSGVPRLLPLPPYEDYAAQLLPQRAGERLAEFGMSLACAVDEAGLDAEAVGLLAEPLARSMLQRLEMSDLGDFRPVVQLWKRVAPEQLVLLWEQEATKDL